MPHCSILFDTEREILLALPDAKDDLIRYYTFSDTDLSVIRQRRVPANRLGFAVQLCYLRFLGVILGVDDLPFPPLLRIVASQLKVPVKSWDDYGQREQTRREHLVELQTVFGFQPFTMRHYWQAVQTLTELATSIKQGTVTASLMLRKLGSYPRQNGLAVALRELGRIERTLFVLDWLQSVELRRRVNAGLNKRKTRNALARAVFFNRLGEIRDRSFEQ